MNKVDAETDAITMVCREKTLASKEILGSVPLLHAPPQTRRRRKPLLLHQFQHQYF